MRTVILSLQDAVETGLKDIDLLEKQDKVIFVYLKGKDNITIGVHNALAQLKCKTEFYEIPDEAATKTDMPMYFAYLVGSNPGAVIIDTGETFAKLTYLNIERYQNFKSLVGGKGIRKTKESVGADQPARKRRTRATVAATTVSKEESKEFPINPPEDGSVTVESKTAEKVIRRQRERTEGKDINDLKQFLHSCATSEYDPSQNTMSIFEAVKKSIAGVPIKNALKETVIIDTKIQKIDNALIGRWSKIEEIVREILQQKERG